MGHINYVCLRGKVHAFAPAAPAGPWAPCAPAAPAAPAGPALPVSDFKTLGLICFVEVITYLLAAYAPPLIANTSATVAIAIEGVRCSRLRSAENIASHFS